MQAAGGLISITGEPGRPGVRVGSSLIDQGTGTWAALGVLAALLERERTGAGCVVDVSLYETAIGYVGYHLAGYLADGTIPTGEGTRFPMVAPYQVMATQDGELLVAGGNDRLFRAICDVVGLPEVVDDARFRTNADRVRNRDALIALIEERLRTEPIGDLARAPPGRRRARRSGRGHPRRRRVAADGGARDPPAARAPADRRPDACPRSRCPSTASAPSIRARRPLSASTRPRSCARPATPTRRSRSSRPPASLALPEAAPRT